MYLCVYISSGFAADLNAGWLLDCWIACVDWLVTGWLVPGWLAHCWLAAGWLLAGCRRAGFSRFAFRRRVLFVPLASLRASGVRGWKWGPIWGKRFMLRGLETRLCAFRTRVCGL